MSRSFLLIFCVFFLIVGCSTAQPTINTTTKTTMSSQKGFLIFGNDDLVVFLPDSNASESYSLEDLQKNIGRQIREDYSKQMIDAKTKSKKYLVQEHVYNEELKKGRLVPMEFGVIPVKIIYYQYQALDMGNNNGIAYIYRDKDYYVKFIDDWNVNIQDIEFLK